MAQNEDQSSKVASEWKKEAHIRDLEGMLRRGRVGGSLSLQPDYGASDAALPRDSAERVASRWAGIKGVAPSAEAYFWHNPQKYEVRQFAETRAISNSVPIAEDATKTDHLDQSKRQEGAKARKAPPTPTEIIKTVPGSENFSTLSRFLIKTDQRTPSIPTGIVNRPFHPDSEEHESVMDRLGPPGAKTGAVGSPLHELILNLQESLPANSVKLLGDQIRVTGSDREEVMGAIQDATKKLKKTFPSMPVSFEVGHKPGAKTHTSFLSVRFD